MKPLIFLICLFILPTARLTAGAPVAQSGKIQSFHLAEIRYTGTAGESDIRQWRIHPTLAVRAVRKNGNTIQMITEQPFRLDTHYYLHVSPTDSIFLRPAGVLDSLYSSKPLGYRLQRDSITFRLFAPRARWVRLVRFDDYRADAGQEFAMRRDPQGVWEYRAPRNWTHSYYGYRLWGPQGEGELFDSTIVVADPYSPAVVTMNHYTHPGKTLIQPTAGFQWTDEGFSPPEERDLIIYEMHVRDLTAHPSSGLPAGQRGYYTSLLAEGQKGGLPYISRLGVNAVELLPTQDFGNMEVPYKDPTAPVYNTWNPYARNHWGYMTSYFFAPESYYATGGNMIEGRYCGANGRQIDEFKQMVNRLHQKGLAVIMDVVYNHVSQYDYNPLKYIDKFYYFRLNNDCSFTSVSGCGNDLKTERPMVRRLILDSVEHWLREYHVDGFRFDLAKMIDWETCDRILQRAREINPQVIIIAEPWGGGYDPAGFSDHGWASWNDQFRNGIKGQNPKDGLSFIFGHYWNRNNRKTMERYIMGSLRRFGGQYLSVGHSINYLESHDDYTLGDFIRIGLGDVDENQRITDPDANARLTAAQMRTNKLAALILLTSQGAVMLGEGQEYARSKVIVKTDVPDPNWGKLDHNSYNKDNATNYLNFHYADMNGELVNYYRGLIALRKTYPAFRRAAPEHFHFYPLKNSLQIVYSLTYNGRKFLVLLNGDKREALNFSLPAGYWGILTDGKRASAQILRKCPKPRVTVPPTSGMILIQL